jgi:predicted AAA+ superfamily ATPase
LDLKDEIVFDYLRGVYNTILYRDIVKRHGLRNAAFLENLIRFLADNIGQLFSAKNISDYLKSQQTKVAVSQIIDYLHYLAQSFMIHRVENIVYKHLIYNDYEVRVGKIGDNEIDFVCKKNGEYLYVQVCYLLHSQKTIEREFGNLEKIKNNYPKIVVSMDDFEGNTRNGIQHFRLNEFLLS